MGVQEGKRPNPLIVRGMHYQFVCFVFLQFLAFTSVFSQVERQNFINYTQERGLSNNVVHCIFHDSRGWLWIGTSQGLNRFDGYKFTVFKNDPDNINTLSGDLVRVIFEDHKGNLWIGTENGGLNKFNRQKENFIHFTHQDDDSKSISGSSVNAIAEDLQGNLWIGTEKGLNKFDTKSGKVTAILQSGKDSKLLVNNFIRTLLIDKSGKLWIGTDQGLDRLDVSLGTITHIPIPIVSKSNDEIHKIFEDVDGKIWVGTYNNGLYIVNPGSLEVSLLNLDPQNERSITVRAIARDRSGKYWIGTRGGLYLYSKTQGEVAHFVHNEAENGSICHNSILDIASDAKGDIWIGTRGGISYMNLDNQSFQHYKTHVKEKKCLNDNEIYSLWAGSTGDLWIGTERGGINILDIKTGAFRYLMHKVGEPNSLSVNCIKAFLDDKQGNIWIGTYMGGIDVINKKTGHITHFKHDPKNSNSLIDNRIWALFLDSRGYIWIGTIRGLERFDPDSKKFIHYNHLFGSQVLWINEDFQHNLWFGGDQVYVYDVISGRFKQFNDRTRGFCQDSKGRIWLATLQKGLARYDANLGPVKYYNEKSGIANNQALCILEDNQGYLWISTGNGLSKFDPEKETFRNFDNQDGLQNNQFNYGAGYKLSTGELVFGGINGFNIFNPLQVKVNLYPPPIVFTELRIFNKPIPIVDHNDAILQKSINETKEIIIPFNKNVVTFEFAALNYAKSSKNKYAYILEGFDKNWNETGEQRSVTYTNLDPGDYIFRVKASNNDNIWNEKGITLKLKILPPYWKTWWFKSLILLIILFIIYLLVVFLAYKAKLKHELVFERIKAKKLHEIDLLKLRFFTNISHEIRTPLTLIIGPLEKMLNYNLSPTELKGHLNLMQRNAKHLMKLINQLLDFRKLESGNLKLELRKGDMIVFLREVLNSFDSVISEKNIILSFNSVEKELFTWFDPDKLEKIVDNLLSNAIKYTDKDGTITVNVSLVIDQIDGVSDNPMMEEKLIEIVVKDTGTGIPDSSINKVFMRFFQESSQNQTGTGIGLALTKELVELHKGKIFVTSKVGKGSKFTVRLPFEQETMNEDIAFVDKADLTTITEKVFPVIDQPNLEMAVSERIILVVEDNSDVRYFISSHFEPDYQVLEACDGKEGWILALKIIPDVIISDILMPHMNGNELCRKVKKDERTSHIPIILLTALSSKENELEGLVAGADDYISKPFDITILRTKVENLLAVRQSLREKYTHEMILQPTNITITSPEERFLKKAIEVVEQNISNPDLDIEKFTLDIGISRMQLYRKMGALTNMTVKEFIRSIRLKRAAQLLLQKKLNVSEIAYAVGFRDLSHFRKCFREQYGMSATDYMNQPEIIN